MVDGFDVVAIWVENERGVVAGAVGSFARRAVVFAAGGDGRGEEAFDCAAVLGLEREMDLRDWSGRPVDPEFVGGEVAGSVGHGVRKAERRERRRVEPLAGG